MLYVLCRALLFGWIALLVGWIALLFVESVVVLFWGICVFVGRTLLEESDLGGVVTGIGVIEVDGVELVMVVGMVERGRGRVRGRTGYDMEGVCGGRGGDVGGRVARGRGVLWDGDDIEVSHEPGKSAVLAPAMVLGWRGAGTASRCSTKVTWKESKMRFDMGSQRQYALEWVP